MKKGHHPHLNPPKSYGGLILPHRGGGKSLEVEREAPTFGRRGSLKMSEVLKTDADLNFLLSLKPEAIETLVPCIRDRVDQIRAAK